MAKKKSNKRTDDKGHGLVYTSYLARLDKLPQDVIKIIVTRYLPKGFSTKGHDDWIWRPQLAPSEELLASYKDKECWAGYKIKYTGELYRDYDKKFSLNHMLKQLRKGTPICLVCYEKDALHCHRTLLANWLSKRGITYGGEL